MSRLSTRLARAVRVERLDRGVWIARGGRWRLVQIRPGWWVVVDGLGRWNDGLPHNVRSLTAGRYLVGAAEHTPEGRR